MGKFGTMDIFSKQLENALPQVFYRIYLTGISNFRCCY